MRCVRRLAHFLSHGYVEAGSSTRFRLKAVNRNFDSNAFVEKNEYCYRTCHMFDNRFVAK